MLPGCSPLVSQCEMMWLEKKQMKKLISVKNEGCCMKKKGKDGCMTGVYLFQMLCEMFTATLLLSAPCRTYLHLLLK